VRPENFRATKAGRKAPEERPRRSIEEIKADLDAIAAEYERIHGKSLQDDSGQAEQSA
jgi:hypothetical protein